MWGRVVAALVAGGVLLAGCGGDSDPSAESVAERLGVEFPAPNPRDNSRTCKSDAGRESDCEQLITTDTVSVWEFPHEETARYWMREGPMSRKEYDGSRRVGRFILTFVQETQRLTNDEVRQGYVDKLREIVDDS